MDAYELAARRLVTALTRLASASRAVTSAWPVPSAVPMRFSKSPPVDPDP